MPKRRRPGPTAPASQTEVHLVVYTFGEALVQAPGALGRLTALTEQNPDERRDGQDVTGSMYDSRRHNKIELFAVDE